MNLLNLISIGSKISGKNAILVLVIAIVLIFILVYSSKDFYTDSQQKVETLSKMYDLKEKHNLDSSTITFLRDLKVKIEQEHSAQEYLTDYIVSIFNPTRRTLFSDGRNQFIQFLTSSYFWIFCICIVPFTKDNSKKSMLYNIYSNVKLFFSLLIIAIGNCFIFNLIPILGASWVNYLINIILQFLEVYSLVLIMEHTKNAPVLKEQ